MQENGVAKVWSVRPLVREGFTSLFAHKCEILRKQVKILTTVWRPGMLSSHGTGQIPMTAVVSVL